MRVMAKMVEHDNKQILLMAVVIGVSAPIFGMLVMIKVLNYPLDIFIAAVSVAIGAIVATPVAYIVMKYTKNALMRNCNKNKRK